MREAECKSLSIFLSVVGVYVVRNSILNIFFIYHDVKQNATRRSVEHWTRANGTWLSKLTE